VKLLTMIFNILSCHEEDDGRGSRGLHGEVMRISKSDKVRSLLTTVLYVVYQ